MVEQTEGHCDRAARALARIRDFVHDERKRISDIPEEAIVRDDRFLDLATEAIARCDRDSLRHLVSEIRGLSHYFCFYSPRLDELDPILDDLYGAVRDAVAGGKSTPT